MLCYRTEWDGVGFVISCHVNLLTLFARKTTTMVFKMLGIERAYMVARLEQPEILPATKARQIFVTHSRKLATHVEQYFCKLSMSLSATTKSKAELKEIAAQQKMLKENDDGLFDVNDDVTWKASLPKKFSLLRDEHFPLFLTFERVSQALFGVTSMLMKLCSFVNYFWMMLKMR